MGAGAESEKGLVRRRFDQFVERAYAVSAAFLVIGLLLFIGAAFLAEGFWRTLLTDLASVTLTIGFVGLPYETFLRRTLSNEILEAVRSQAEPILDAVALDERLRASGLKVVHRRPVIWDSFIASAQSIQLLPSQPTEAWRGGEWRAVLELATRRAVAIDVYLPPSSGPHLPSLARRLKLDEEQATRQLDDFLLNLGTDWDAAAVANPPLQSGATLRVYTYDGLPTFGLVIAGEACAMTVPSAIGVAGATPTITFEFAVGTDDFFHSWFQNQLSGMASKGLVDKRVVQ